MSGTVSTMKRKFISFAGQVFGRRLIAAYSILFVTVFVITGFFLNDRLQKQALLQLKESLADQAYYVISQFPPESFSEADKAALQERVLDISAARKARITLILNTGLVLADSERTFAELEHMENHAARPEVQQALQGRLGSVIRNSRTLGIEMLYVAVPVFHSGSVLGVLRMALPLDNVNKVRDSIRRPVTAGILVGLAAVLLLGMLLGYSISNRVSRISAAALKYAEGQLNQEIHLGGDDELTYLADTMNRMARSLKKRMSETDEERAKLLLVLNNMTEGVIAINSEGRILLVNPSAENILEISGKKIEGKALWSVVKKSRIDEMVRTAISDQTIVEEEIEFLFKERKIIKTHVIGVSQGDVAGIIVLADMTKIRNLERVRKDFVANVSHELRTPLTSLQGFVETLLGGALKDEEAATRFLKIMEEDVNRLSRLIDDLLTLSRLESKQESLQYKRIHLNAEVSQILERFRANAESKNLKLIDETSDAADIYLSADRDKLHQVFVNLLDNAIKYNRDNGEVRLRAAVRGETVEITIEDTGIGIPQEAMGRLFERFSRVDKARSREMGGTGLGLSIVKHIVEKHGGQVACESVWGKGSVFTVTLPVSH